VGLKGALRPIQLQLEFILEVVRGDEGIAQCAGLPIAVAGPVSKRAVGTQCENGWYASLARYVREVSMGTHFEITVPVPGKVVARMLP
jgi:hypothetical protein